MSFAFTYGLQFGPAAIAAGTIRVAILMTNTNVTDKQDAEHVDDITLDEMNGANYVRKTLASVTAAANTDDDSFNVDCANVVWSALGAGSREMAGLLVYYFDTDDAGSTPLAWIDDGGFPLAGDGTDFTWTVAELGFIRDLAGL